MIEVVMPQMGESIAEGTIVKWLKAAGDAVARDEPLLEITTDKVDTEVPSPAAGTLKRILVNEGETVDVGTPLAEIEAPGAADEIAPSAAPERVSTTPVTPEPVPEGAGGHFRATQASQTVSFQPRPKDAGAGARAGAGRSYSPAVLETARQGGLSLGELTGLRGSGRDGRVTKRDVDNHLRQRGPSPGPGGATSEGSGPPDEYLYRPTPEDQRVPMSPVRRKIAHHMSWSTRISPHATAIAECDMSRAAALIERAGERFSSTSGAPLTYTVLIAEAAVRALSEFPSLNASVVGDEIVLKPSVHLGVAVALPDNDELIVPVIREAEGLSRSGLARAIRDLAGRARERRLRPEDVQGGTFTLTNPGIFGGLTGTPILHQPQVAILGLGAVIKRPVVVDDAIAIRSIVLMSLTFDHRAADGMMAFRYLARVRDHLEQLPEEE